MADLSKNLADILVLLQRELRIECVHSLESIQLNLRSRQSLVHRSALSLLRDLNLEHVVTCRVLQIDLRLQLFVQPIDNSLELTDRQAELNQRVSEHALLLVFVHACLITRVAYLNLVAVREEELLANHAPSHDDARVRGRL